MRTSLRKLLYTLVFAGGMLGVSLTALVQAVTCTTGLGPICTTIGGFALAQTASAPMLVLYGAPLNDQYINLGKAYAIILHNLFTHFNAIITLLLMQNCTAGMTEQYTTTFYMGSYYNNPVPAALLSGVTTTQKTAVWFKYNLWEPAWNTAHPFTTRYGITFSSLMGMNAAPSASTPNPGLLDTITYKNQTTTRYYAFNATTSAISADLDIGPTVVANATKATGLVTTTNSVTKAIASHVVRSGNFWYFTDMPFSYIGSCDRYLVVCGMLHDIFGTNAPTLHRVLVQLEDMNATTMVPSIQTLTDYMHGQKIPFSIAAIPVYTDPNRIYNGGMAQTIHMADATGLKQALNYIRARGGHVLMHGYTHQYSNVPNVTNAVSMNDHEFWFATQNRPVNEDSTRQATGRLSAGLLELRFNGYFPFAWEASHYQSLSLAIEVIPTYFKNTYQRVVYYMSDNPQALTVTTPSHDFSVGQFFPYIIQKDYHGQHAIPENLGNVKHNICLIDPSSCLTYNVTDILTNANYALVMRDGFASFFFHPFWLEPGLVVTGLPDFQQIITGITALGYTWADANTVQ